MPAKKIAKVVKVVKPQPVVDEVDTVEVDSPVVVDTVEEVVVEAPKEASLEELIGKFFLDAQDDKESRLMISVGGPKGTVSIERYGLVPKIVFGKSLLDAMQKIG